MDPVSVAELTVCYETVIKIIIGSAVIGSTIAWNNHHGSTGAEKLTEGGLHRYSDEIMSVLQSHTLTTSLDQCFRKL